MRSDPHAIAIFLTIVIIVLLVSIGRWMVTIF